WGLARFNADGTPDPTFSTNGLGTEELHPTEHGAAQSVLLQPDGRIIVFGAEEGAPAIARFNPDGSLDKSFNGGFTLFDRFLPSDWGDASAWLTEDGKIMLVGLAGYGAWPWLSILTTRLNADGTTDWSYGDNGYSVAGIDDNAAPGDFLLRAARPLED